MRVKPKKYLGQHFLKDENISLEIVSSLRDLDKTGTVLEIGPGTGALTKYFIDRKNNFLAFEVDEESIEFLAINYPSVKVIKQDILDYNFNLFKLRPVTIIGNFPYNISSQILFKAIDFRFEVNQLVGMFQKEVAERVVSPPGSKKYGILSVLIQAYFNTEYLFTVDEDAFIPPPKVKSGVIRLIRNDVKELGCDEKLFFKIVKTTFNQRRKMIRNSIKNIIGKLELDHEFLTKRPEQLTVDNFISLTNFTESIIKTSNSNQ
ncbi:MAG: ribosomal RNA small subunit methyltransferase A [Crocinitomicaceae bacterium]|nr:ribosomal RNA small subunit methyltransferase A [Crocinitomicaceae bacterium]|tara:strand:+ start:1498 stop:2283 length:786 start_codon:yes stop_codon:yes gene_type:complete